MRIPKRPLKILIAIDGSEYSRAAVSLLCDLPLPDESMITCLSVLAPLRQHQRPVLETALEQARSKLQETHQQVSIEMRQGHPASEIVEFTDQHKSDLIILGAKGLRDAFDFVLGGVAQQVVELARCPVLIVRMPYIGLQQILLVTDGSPQSQRAVDFLGHLALPPQVSVKVAHVLPPPPLDEFLAKTGYMSLYPTVSVPWDEIAEQSTQQMREEESGGKKLLEITVRRLEASGVKASQVLLRGDAATEIVTYTKESGINLIVAGSRGLGPLRGWLLGSVSRKLVHHAGCSVLVVKGGSSNTDGW